MDSDFEEESSELIILPGIGIPASSESLSFQDQELDG